MKIFFLLPHRFKKIGILLFFIGSLIWGMTQRGYKFDFVEQNPILNVIVLAISFFMALFGLYFMVFSQEQVEDEFIKSLRLKSFQISSLVQLMFFIISFASMFIFHLEPKGDGGLVLFLLSSIFIYWLVYILYFNLSLIVIKMKFDEK